MKKPTECPYCDKPQRDERDYECGSYWDEEDEIVVLACGAIKIEHASSALVNEIMAAPRNFPGDPPWEGVYTDPRLENPFKRRNNSIDGDDDKSE